MTTATTHNDTAAGQLRDQTDARITLALPGTDYQLHLNTAEPLPDSQIGKTVRGTIHARAKRVDVVHTGGRYLEPIIGRPRRIQGTVRSVDISKNTITVRCACPFICELTTKQFAADIPTGALVAFDIEPGATFEPINHT